MVRYYGLCKALHNMDTTVTSAEAEGKKKRAIKSNSLDVWLVGEIRSGKVRL